MAAHPLSPLFVASAFGAAAASALALVRLRRRRLPVIAVDIDEVIGAFLPALIKWHNDTYGTVHTLRDFQSYRFCDTWGGTNAEATEKVHAFFETPYFLSRLEPIQGALDVLRRFQGRATFKVVTSRQHVIAQATLEWLEAHFPGVFADVFFGNHWTLANPDPSKITASKMTKLDMCRKGGAIALIDDNPSYATQCAEGGLELVVLFGVYGWNRVDTSGHPAIVRAKDWEQVEAILDTFLAKR
eukprot:g753.t1